MELAWVSNCDPLAYVGLERPLSLHQTQEGQPQRTKVENFIQNRFALHYQAKIQQFMPILFSLENQKGEVEGAFGVRTAEHKTLFLERYLDSPIEEMISKNWKGPAVQRKHIIEVGNLAAAGAASARFLIVALTDLLATLGFQWVVFTGTPALLNSFYRLKIDLIPLAPANPECMGQELSDWGSYYNCAPHVTAGNVLRGSQSLIQQNIYSRLGYHPLYTSGDLANVAC